MTPCQLTQWDYDTARNHTASCRCNICTHAHCPADADCKQTRYPKPDSGDKALAANRRAIDKLRKGGAL